MPVTTLRQLRPGPIILVVGYTRAPYARMGFGYEFIHLYRAHSFFRPEISFCLHNSMRCIWQSFRFFLININYLLIFLAKHLTWDILPRIINIRGNIYHIRKRQRFTSYNENISKTLRLHRTVNDHNCIFLLSNTGNKRLKK